MIKSVTPSLASPKAYSKTAATSKNTNNISECLLHTPNNTPVNAPGLLETPPGNDLNKTLEEPTLKPVSQRFAAWSKKLESPEPSRQPVSAKLANFEQKTSQNTPRLGLAGSVPVPRTPKQVLFCSLSFNPLILPCG